MGGGFFNDGGLDLDGLESDEPEHTGDGGCSIRGSGRVSGVQGSSVQAEVEMAVKHVAVENYSENDNEDWDEWGDED